MTNTNGYTNKEMLHFIRVEVEELHKIIDYLHEKINMSSSNKGRNNNSFSATWVGWTKPRSLEIGK